MLAAEKYGAEVTSYGLVRSQNDAMRMLMRSRNFRGKVTLVEKDIGSWRTSLPAMIGLYPSGCMSTQDGIAMSNGSGALPPACTPEASA